MANIIFSERENLQSLHAPTLKMRQRLQSAPGMKMQFSQLYIFFLFNASAQKHAITSVSFSHAEKLLKSPMIAKSFNTPLPSGRKAFGAVNKQISTPAIKAQEKKLLKPQVGKAHESVQNIYKAISHKCLFLLYIYLYLILFPHRKLKSNMLVQPKWRNFQKLRSLSLMTHQVTDTFSRKFLNFYFLWYQRSHFSYSVSFKNGSNSSTRNHIVEQEFDVKCCSIR